MNRGALIARDKPNVISDQRALAYFYNNRAAELMATGDGVAEGRHLDAAIAMDASSAAEKAYTTALKLDAMHAATLSKIVSLHQRAGEQAQAARFLRGYRRHSLRTRCTS